MTSLTFCLSRCVDALEGQIRALCFTEIEDFIARDDAAAAERYINH